MLKKYLNYSILFIYFFFCVKIYSLPELKLDQEDFKLIISSENMKNEKEEKLDINTATKVEMLSRGVGSTYVNKIIDYREITGGIEDLKELTRIKGIGDATYRKLSEKFSVKSEVAKRSIYINKINDEELKYFGFTNKEIKNLRKYLEKNGKIYDNIELRKILGNKKYEKIKNQVEY